MSRTIHRLLAVLALAASFFFPTLGHADAPMTGRTHAVLVGIADYPSSPLMRTDVDAERIARALARNVPADRLRTHLLLNARATRRNVMDALATVQREATEGDNVVFFFSGHGSPVADGDEDEGDMLDEVLALYDGNLTDDELALALDGTKSRLTLVGIDACFSGGFLFDVGDRAGRMTLLSSDEDLTSAVPQNEAGGWLSLLLARALEGEADGVANGVQGQARDNMLTALEIEVFIRQQSAQLPSISATDPAGRTVGYQFIDIKRTGVRPDMVVMQVGEGSGEMVVTPQPVLGDEVASFPGQRLSPSGNTHSVELTAGTHYLIETGALGGAADTVIELVRDGQVLAQNDDAAPGDLSSRVELTAPATGTYEVRVRPYAPSTLGSYSLRVASLGDSSFPAVEANGESIFHRAGLRLAAGGETHEVQLQPGHYVIETSALTGAADTLVRVTRGGAPVAENDDVAMGNLASRVELDVTSAGTYAIEVRPYGPETLGTYALTVRSGRGAAVAPVQPVAPILQPGAPTQEQFDFENLQLTAAGITREVELNPGHFVVATRDLSQGADTVVEILFGGAVIAQNDDDPAAGDLSSRVEFDARTAGTYTIRIRPYAPTTLGSFSVSVNGAPSAPVGTSPNVGPVDGVLNLPGLTLGATESVHQVELEAGRTYVFETRVHGSADTVMQLRSGGQVVAQNDDVSPDDLSSRIEITAPAAGTYEVAVRPYAPMTTGTYDLSITAR